MSVEALTAARAGRILIVDDEPDMASGLKQFLRRHKFDVDTVGVAEQALERLKEEPVDLVLTDLMLPGMSGLELLERIKATWPETFVVMFTGFATVENAVQAIRKGAFDYISKPFTPQQLEVVVNRVFQHKALTDENRSLRGQIRDRFRFESLIGFSEPMKKIHALLSRVASTDASVLIIGESGTGKELIARAVHANSRRQDKPFIPLDCAALPLNLLESELFGYEKGAFTGAITSRAGLLEAAHGGTFFMDEIGELDLSLQVKLLRVLQERQFRRVGGSKIITVDVRIVAATNRDLEKEVRAGRFREDLYHRLNVIQVRLPPLRERQGDILILANHFLNRFGPQVGKPGARLNPEAMMALEAYDWPGNVRELQNAIEYGISLSEDLEIELYELPLSVQQSPHVRHALGQLAGELAAAEGASEGASADGLSARASVQDGASGGERVSATGGAGTTGTGARATVAEGAEAVSVGVGAGSKGLGVVGTDRTGRGVAVGEGARNDDQTAGAVPAGSGSDDGLERAASSALPDVHHELPYKKAKRKWLEAFEREYFTGLLKRHRYNISHAARAAQIDRKSIQRIMKRNNLDIDQIVEDE